MISFGQNKGQAYDQQFLFIAHNDVKIHHNTYIPDIISLS